MTQATQKITRTVMTIDGHPATVIQDYVGGRLLDMHEQPEKAGLTISGFLDNIRYMLDVVFLDLDEDAVLKFQEGYDGYMGFMADVTRYSQGFVSANTSVLDPPHPIWVKIVVELAFQYIIKTFGKLAGSNKISVTVMDGWTRLASKVKKAN